MSLYRYQTRTSKGAWETIVIYSNPESFTGKFAPTARDRAWRIIDDSDQVVASFEPRKDREHNHPPRWEGSWAALMADLRAGKIGVDAIIPKPVRTLPLAEFLAHEMRFGPSSPRIYA